MPAPKKPAKASTLRHITARLRVTVDPQAWERIYGGHDLADDVRRYVVNQIAESGAARSSAIVSVRRDGDKR